MDDLLVQLLQWLYSRRGKIAGTLLGLFFGWMIVAYGVFKAAFVAVCLIVGYAAGAWFDEGPPGGRGLFRRR